MDTLDIKTHSRVEFQDITEKVSNIVAKSGVSSGICVVYVPHTTAGITINEHADPSVVEDIAAQLGVMVPRHINYRHTEGNAPAHIKASLIGSSVTVIIDGGKLKLGTWQGIFFCEFDGPRDRNALVYIIAEKAR